MLRLIIMRHAKAVAEGDGPDKERALTERGLKAAFAAGQKLAKNQLIPGQILCSPATRTRQTLAQVMAGMGTTPPVILRESLYAFGDGSPYLEAIAKEGREIGTLMIIGHNPSVHSLALRLSGHGSDPQALSEMRGKYPTAAMAVLAFDLPDWSMIGVGGGRLESFLTPKGGE
jgi:phosphohistidine phosphatase